MLRISLQLLASYLRLSGCRAPSNGASPGTMSIGDWRGPLAMGKLSAHLSGPLKLHLRENKKYIYISNCCNHVHKLIKKKSSVIHLSFLSAIHLRSWFYDRCTLFSSRHSVYPCNVISALTVVFCVSPRHACALDVRVSIKA